MTTRFEVQFVFELSQGEDIVIDVECHSDDDPYEFTTPETTEIAFTATEKGVSSPQSFSCTLTDEEIAIDETDNHKFSITIDGDKTATLLGLPAVYEFDIISVKSLRRVVWLRLGEIEVYKALTTIS